MRYAIGLLMVIALSSGCATAQKERVLVPTTVELPVRQYVSIPDELLQECEIAKGKLHEVVNVAKRRAVALEKCNAQLRAIRDINGKAVHSNPD